MLNSFKVLDQEGYYDYPDPKHSCHCMRGPCPRINGVISSVTIEARKSGWDVYGIYDGFSTRQRGEEDYAAYHRHGQPDSSDGGSILRTSRFNPAKSEEHLRRVVHPYELGVTHLVTIGVMTICLRGVQDCGLREELPRADHQLRPRAKDHRQRPSAAGGDSHLRLRNRPVPRGADRLKPHGGCEDHRAVVPGGGHGAGGGAPCAWHRQERRRHHNRYPGGASGRGKDSPLPGGGHNNRFNHQASGCGEKLRRGGDRRGAYREDQDGRP